MRILQHFPSQFFASNHFSPRNNFRQNPNFRKSDFSGSMLCKGVPGGELQIRLAIRNASSLMAYPTLKSEYGTSQEYFPDEIGRPRAKYLQRPRRAISE